MINLGAALDNGAQYEVWLSSAEGTRLKVLDTVAAFRYTRVVNAPGAFEIALPFDFDETLLYPDRRVLFWRRPPGAAMYLDMVGLIDQIDVSDDENGNTTRRIGGAGLADLLRRRHVLYNANSAYTQKTDQADDLMKAIVRENLGSSATTANGRKRDGQISSTYFSVASDGGLGPSVTKGFAWRNVLTVLQELSNEARDKGTEIYFDIEPLDEVQFQFQTFVNQRGRDRTGSLTFGRKFGNVASPNLSKDWGNEINFIVAAGAGEDTLRITRTAEATWRSGRSPFALREGFADKRSLSDPTTLTDAAQGAVTAGRPVKTFSGDLLSVPRSVYGLTADWYFGDRVPITYTGAQFEALIRAVTISVDDTGRETIKPVYEADL